MRRAGWFLRSTAGAVLVAFGSLTMTPVVLAAEHAYAEQAMQAQAKANAKGDMGKLLVKVRDELRVLADKPDVLDRKPNKDQRKAAKAALKALRAELHSLDKEVRAEFAVNQDMIKAKKLAAVIQERQDAAVAQYAAEYAALEYSLAAIEGKDEEADARGAAASAYERLAKQKLERSQQAFDPNDLPNKSLKPDRTRVPKTDPLAWVDEGLYNNPQLLVASTAPFDYSKLAGAGNPAYLAATTEVVLSDAIVAKAAELNHDPVKIYGWVRNNVVWQPTWGAIQDAELTLSAQRGNAFDIASLTIALLRASGIPARYVHGTIDVPEADFRSWMGDWQHLNPAIDFASAGGIPIQPITSGGRITKVRMEHIWVEAAIDFMPSRGAKNLSADTWLALDPSFKRMELSQGLDPVSIADLDSTVLADEAWANSSRDTAEGWVSGIDSTVFAEATGQMIDLIGSYLDENPEESTLENKYGSRSTVDIVVSNLPPSMPNVAVTVGARYGVIPGTLRQTISFAFGRDAAGELVEPLTLDWPAVNNRQISLSFRPSAQTDFDALSALLPQGSATTVADLPSSIPAYLINVVPELRLEGQVVMTGRPMRLGVELEFSFNPKFAGRFELARNYKVIAGSFLSVAVVGGDISSLEVARTFERVKSVSGSGHGPQATDSESLFGAYFHSGVLAYYARLLRIAEVAGTKRGGRFQLAAGLGSYGYEAEAETLFGVTRAVTRGMPMMNIPMVQVVGFDDLDQAPRANFSLEVGINSSMLEHIVPERHFRGEEIDARAFSAVRLISRASQQGQKIFRINRSNEAVVVPQLSHVVGAISEMRAAIAAGKSVVTHSSPIDVDGYVGSGYIIVDPESGDGAFRISGGQNGSAVIVAGVLAFAALGFMMWMVIAPLLAGVTLWAAAVGTIELALILDQLLTFGTLIQDLAASSCPPEYKEAMIKRASFLVMIEATIGKLVDLGPGRSPIWQENFAEDITELIGLEAGTEIVETITEQAEKDDVARCDL